MIIKPGKFDYEWTDSQREKFDKDNEDFLNKNIMLDILFFGDSITACWQVGKIFNGNKTILNRAIGGDRTRYMLYRFDADCIQIFPKKVILLGGINDIRAWSRREDYFYNMDDNQIEEEITNNFFSIARKCKANDIELIISSILPIDEDNIDNELINEKIQNINDKIKKYCILENLKYINYYDDLVIKETKRIEKIMTTDGLHPNEKGYEIMKATLLKELGDRHEI